MVSFCGSDGSGFGVVSEGNPYEVRLLLRVAQVTPRKSDHFGEALRP